jgi:holo-[acyl-carrier protein] synthase
MTGPTKALAGVVTALGESPIEPGGVGIDLVEVADVVMFVDAGGVAFLEAAWTPHELSECEGSIERLAARWAAKEAVMKALGRGLGQLSPLDVEVQLDVYSGEPRVVLHRQALMRAEERSVVGWSLSLCHENGWAAAIAIARTDLRASPRNG